MKLDRGGSSVKANNATELHSIGGVVHEDKSLIERRYFIQRTNDGVLLEWWEPVGVRSVDGSVLAYELVGSVRIREDEWSFIFEAVEKALDVDPNG